MGEFNITEHGEMPLLKNDCGRIALKKSTDAGRAAKPILQVILPMHKMPLFLNPSGPMYRAVQKSEDFVTLTQPAGSLWHNK